MGNSKDQYCKIIGTTGFKYICIIKNIATPARKVGGGVNAKCFKFLASPGSGKSTISY